MKKGALATEIQIQELNKSNQLRIQLSEAMSQIGRPFFHLVEQSTEGQFKYEYEKNPKIKWVVEALEQEGLELRRDSYRRAHV